MEVVIDSNAGYCFGVVNAIDTAEAELRGSSTLYCLGDIVHNSAEVSRLEREGLQVIDHSQLDRLNGCRVLIRAHGEPPETYAAARARNIKLIDATCPIVLALQRRIRQGYEEMQRVGGQIVIFGKPGHAEVIGLTGQTANSAIVVSSPDHFEAVDLHRPIRLYSQTTKSRDEYRKLIEGLRRCLPEGSDFVAYDTICNRVANRARQLEDFAKSVDVLLFVAGANSSNGHYLYHYCRQVQPSTHLIGGPDDLVADMLAGARRVGISGATSTPRWLMEEVAAKVNDFNDTNPSI